MQPCSMGVAVTLFVPVSQCLLLERLTLMPYRKHLIRKEPNSAPLSSQLEFFALLNSWHLIGSCHTHDRWAGDKCLLSAQNSAKWRCEFVPPGNVCATEGACNCPADRELPPCIHMNCFCHAKQCSNCLLEMVPYPHQLSRWKLPGKNSTWPGQKLFWDHFSDATVWTMLLDPVQLGEGRQSLNT